VECGAFPLYEIEDGQRYTLNSAPRSRPVADYLALQRRYRGLPAQQVQALQAEVDEAWARLQQRAAASAPATLSA
jgi:pyruvate ferredoxin oxidoreductase beta subunit/2-oxoisovalerate ferredoxin oxidoreductase beta subunit